MASTVEICSRGLQKLGAKVITSLTDGSANAAACNVCYHPLRRAELRKHSWGFAIERAQLAADSTAPLFGRANAFALPSKFLKLLAPYPEDNLNDLDWQIEGRRIYTDDDAPLAIRYIWDVEDPNLMDPLFRELMSTKIAWELCEYITQSNTKKKILMAEYVDIIAEAKKANAIERVAALPPEDTWITVRA